MSNMEQEFAEFLKSEPVPPPPETKARLMAAVSAEFHPRPTMIFVKLCLVVFFIGLLNMTICPQFGLGFVRHSGLFEYFMGFGSYGCKVACGSFFLGSGMIVGIIILRPEELRVLRLNRFLLVSALSLLSLTGFVAAGASVYFAAALAWFAGSVVTSLLALEGGIYLRRIEVPL
jgi:hypothetical protein